MAVDGARQIGRYQIVGRLAEGGMAELLLGRVVGPAGFERAVALKRILPRYADTPEFRAMFVDEAKIAAAISHPNVVHHYELGQEDGELFLVMEYLEGEPSAGLLRRAKAFGRELPIELAVWIVAEACAGLHAAHESRDSRGNPREIVHRDISPHNVFVCYGGNVKVLDFGIAKAADRITRTEAGMLKGKYAYMSPEQTRGESLDRRSDVFALGIVLYELTTGSRLFHRGTPLAALRAVSEAEIVPPSKLVPDYPPSVEAVCMRALQRDREDRHPSADAFRRALLEVLRELGGAADPAGQLRELMVELFPDRIEEKRLLLARLQSGDSISAVPEAEIDLHVSLPTAIELGSIARPEPSKSRSSWIGVTIVGAVLAASAGAVITVATSTGEPVEASGPTQPIQVQVHSDPESARIFVDGELRGRTPAALRFEESHDPVELELQLDGFETTSQTLVPDMDQRLSLVLRPETTTPEGGGPAATPTPGAAARRHNQRRRPPRMEAMTGETTMEGFPRFD